MVKQFHLTACIRKNKEIIPEGSDHYKLAGEAAGQSRQCLRSIGLREDVEYFLCAAGGAPCIKKFAEKEELHSI